MNNQLNVLKKIEERVSKQDYSGYDPYDLKSISIFIPFQKNKYTNFAINKIVESPLSPMLRKIFCKKIKIPKAMGLFASGYINLYKATRDKEYLRKAEYCLDWLIQNRNKDGVWGYPLNWQSRVFFPKNTSCGVVTSICARAFLEMYDITKEKKHLNILSEIGKFLTKKLNIDIVSDDEVCFSYTPLDNFHVHNANMHVGETLLKLSKLFNRREYEILAIKALNYTARRQNEDGSWYYWSKPDKVLYRIDNYHTGFVLDSLYSYKKILGKKFKYDHTLDKGVDYYRKNLFDGPVAKNNYKTKYPIDIHGCAQGIITFSKFDVNFSKKIFNWTVENMFDKDKHYFYYRKYKVYTSKSDFMRWAQAWMFYAVSELLLKTW